MTDYFALFEEARRPWLDPEKLKEKYFARARKAPADAELNEGFRVLSDPKLRLHHLLTLEGANLGAQREIPPALAELFWNTGTLLREVDHWLLKNTNANSALSRALLSGEGARLEQKLRAHEGKLNAARENVIERLQAIDGTDWSNDLGKLLPLYDSLAYLNRLCEQVKEKQFRMVGDT